mmetsp:Transcript_36021/g.87040  ORF Transcript_36021/g.87040 Transcript_36021/m.87040 type:complete len:130 (-) Transcript_36021:642-1031(-)
MNRMGVATAIVRQFFIDNFELVMVKLVQVCDKTGVGINHMVVELDFVKDHDGTVPAMRDPPSFKVAPIWGYVEGDRPDEPVWFAENRKRNPESYKRALAGMEVFRSTFASEGIWYLVHHGGTVVFSRSE